MVAAVVGLGQTSKMIHEDQYRNQVLHRSEPRAESKESQGGERGGSCGGNTPSPHGAFSQVDHMYPQGGVWQLELSSLFSQPGRPLPVSPAPFRGDDLIYSSDGLDRAPTFPEPDSTVSVSFPAPAFLVC